MLNATQIEWTVDRKYRFWYHGQPRVVRVEKVAEWGVVCFVSLAVNRDGSLGAYRSFRYDKMTDVAPLKF